MEIYRVKSRATGEQYLVEVELYREAGEKAFGAAYRAKVQDYEVREYHGRSHAALLLEQAKTDKLLYEGELLPTDRLGRFLRVGDIIVYPTTVGRSAACRIGTIRELYHPFSDTWRGKQAHEVDTDKWHMKVEYAPEGMDWGISSYDPKWEQKYHGEEAIRLRKGGKLSEDLVKCYAREGKSEAEGVADMLAYHEKKLAKAEEALKNGPKPNIQTLQFPEKSVVITDIYPGAKAA